MPDRNNLKGEGFILAHGVRGSVMVGWPQVLGSRGFGGGSSPLVTSRK
jgi:hypothetical protein